MNILVTGGLGYIGSHVCVELLGAGHQVVVVDNLCNSDKSVFERIALAARSDGARVALCSNAELFHNAVRGGEERALALCVADMREGSKLNTILHDYHVDAVIHLAALKAVGDSVAAPLKYYDANVGGMTSLLTAMAAQGVKKLVFSSSAAVYGDNTSPLTEDMTPRPASPYGHSKAMGEQIIRDVAASDSQWSTTMLRYFNPIGAHQSGQLGENPKGVPSNLLPYLVQVARGQREVLTVHGSDYPTQDGTAVRDYLHVCDLAHGHVLALMALMQGVHVYNLGTGKGVSVRQVVDAFEKGTGMKLNTVVGKRREGDVAICYADAKKAKRALGFETKHTLIEMCIDHFHGYQGE